ncbi:unnamed protein product [Amaranthus hypochondriacus]
MELAQNFPDVAAERRSNEAETTNLRYNSGLAPTIESEKSEGSFDCNICFDLAHDPVVTLCGHLYCWACIFKWLHVKISSSQPETQDKTCPICKTTISETSLIPLYCHSPSHAEDELRTSHYDFIPPRPNVAPNSPSYRGFRYGNLATSNLVSPTMAGINNLTTELLWELMSTRMFRNTSRSSFSFPTRNSYATVGFNNPRTQRQELQIEKSLNRVSMFLFFCIVVCLLFF